LLYFADSDSASGLGAIYSECMCNIRVLGILLESPLDRPNAGKNIDLHGSATDEQKVALLLIDVINDFDFPEAHQLLKYA
jgi:hypothetical protein